MIFVAGAGGTVGGEVVRQLALAEARVRCGYHSPAKVAAARKRGVDAIAIDYAQPSSLHAALQGCDKVYLLGPNVIEQTRFELNLVEAAQAAGVRYIVKQSVIGAADQDFELAAVHRPVELAIEASGLHWTFLRPSSFIQNVTTYMGETIRAEDAFYSASGSARQGHVDVRDIAAVAVKSLTEPGHEFRAYTLTGPEALSYDDLARELSRVLRRPIAHIDLPPASLKDAFLSAGLPDLLADRMLDLERHFREGRAANITDDIRRVTGREPRRIQPFLAESATLLARSQPLPTVR